MMVAQLFRRTLCVGYDVFVENCETATESFPLKSMAWHDSDFRKPEKSTTPCSDKLKLEM